MRQVPTYLIIGNGRVARHFSHYLGLLKIEYHQWDRSQPFSALQTRLAEVTHVLILLHDDAIESFIAAHLSSLIAKRIHFSGSLVTPAAYGAHPLMTFGHDLYAEAEYRSISFIIDADAPSFEELLPGFPNQHIRLSSDQKAKYHALCVLGGNFSCLLWQKCLSEFENELNIPASAAHPYMQRQIQNLMTDYHTALTGPLIRNDMKTMNKHLQALANDPFRAVYQSFVECYRGSENENT